MYTFEGFVDEITTNITQYLSEEYNNSVPVSEPSAFDSDRFLIIPENIPGIVPCISLKYYYKAYKKGVPFNKIMIMIAKDREKLKPNINLDSAFTLDKIKNHLIMRLSPIGNGLPGLQMGDVKLVFYLIYESEDYRVDNEVSLTGINPNFVEIPITEKALYTLKLSPEKLYHIAMKNPFFNNRYKVKGLNVLIKETFGADALLDVDNIEDNGQLAITSDKIYYDAAGILAPKVQENISFKLGRDYVVAIPTLHMAIAMKRNVISDDELKGVVKMSYEATPLKDRLSDKLYYIKNGLLIPVR